MINNAEVDHLTSVTTELEPCFTYSSRTTNPSRLHSTIFQLRNTIFTKISPFRFGRRANLQHARYIAASSVVILLTACATPNYSGEISKFTNTLKKADAALNTLNEKSTSEYTSYLQKRISETPAATIIRKKDDCSLQSTRCRLEISANIDELNGKPYPATSVLRNIVAVMNQLNLYATNLNAIVNDDAVTTINGHVKSALSHIDSLAKTADVGNEQPSQEASSFTVSLGAVASWFIGKYVDRVKVDALIYTIRQADPVVQDSVSAFAATSVFGNDLNRREYADEIDSAIEELTDDPNNSDKIAAAVAAAQKYDRFLRSDPGKTFS